MSGARILAIDQGTTSTRAVMFNAAGEPIAVAQKPLQQHFPADGWVEHDAEDIWQAALACCHEVIAKTGGVDGI